MVGEKGIDAVTIGEIAERADVAFGSFYNHFPTKDDIIEALVAEAVDVYREHVDTMNLQFTKPAELLANATRLTVHLAGLDPLWGWLVLRVGMGRLDLVAPLRIGLERDVRNGIASGAFAQTKPDVLIAVIGGAAIAAIAARLAGTFDDDDEWDVAESILRQAGLTPAAARTTVARVRAAQPKVQEAAR